MFTSTVSTITGNSSTKDEVVRRELRQMEGAWLSNDRLEMSKLRLQRLPYIEKVEFETKDVAGFDDKVDVKFTVKERQSGSFNAGVAFGSYQGLSFQFGVEQQNFLGSGNSAGINFQYQQIPEINQFILYRPILHPRRCKFRWFSVLF